jgi:hypothetical protein
MVQAYMDKSKQLQKAKGIDDVPSGLAVGVIIDAFRQKRQCKKISGHIKYQTCTFEFSSRKLGFISELFVFDNLIITITLQSYSDELMYLTHGRSFNAKFPGV